jgi:hypothetical protein
MAVPSRSRVTLRILVEGFEGARVRFVAAAGTGDSDDAFIALFDVVAWAGANGDWLRKRSKAKNRVNPPVLQGLWYVRNRVLHYGADALFQSAFLMPAVFGGVPFGVAPLAGGYPVLAWAWKPSRSLPRGTSRVGKKEYDSLLAGRFVTETLETASAELARKVRSR